MNVYLQMEIKARELEGRMLLALVAAERGHRVLLGDLRRYLENAPAALPPGLFHDKSLTPSRRKLALHGRLVSEGWRVTSQDEEHWLNLPTFEVPARKRFSSASLANAARAFAWGDHEVDSLGAVYPEHAARIVATGSPRVDLWRAALGPMHDAASLAGTEGRRGFVLFASNFVPALEASRFWARMRDKRQHYDGLEDPVEFARYDAVADRYRLLGPFVRAIRRVATSRPDQLVVVRPHPVEARGAWTDLIGPLPNVLVSRQGPLTPWVRRAAVLVQCDSTSGYEAAVVGTPVVSFTPQGLLADSVVNRLGRRADDIASLERLIDEALAASDDAAARSAWLPTDGRALLERRIAALDGPLAADRIVDAWDALAVEGPAWSTTRIALARRRVLARHRLGTLKRRALDGDRPRSELPGSAAARTSERSDDPFVVAHKFPPITDAELATLVPGLQRALGRFADVRVRRLGSDLVAIEPGAGGVGTRGVGT